MIDSGASAGEPTTELTDDFSDLKPVAKVIQPFRLAPKFVPRIWGRTDLKPWYASTGTAEPVGEAWLTGPDCTIETGPLAGRTLKSVTEEFGPALLGPGSETEFPLLLKILFPNDKLSVQVHPNDEQAQQIGLLRGKTECWYVLDAEPDAAVALGLKPGVDAAAIAAAVQDQSMESLMEFVPVAVGDMVYVDAGTVHAIGPGVTIFEAQQTCDVTYRLYDYGRPRELHLEAGLKVVNTKTDAGKIEPRAIDGFVRLIEQKYFTVDKFEGPWTLSSPGPSCLVSLKGTGLVAGGGVGVELPAGRAVVVPAGMEVEVIDRNGELVFVRCSAPL